VARGTYVAGDVVWAPDPYHDDDPLLDQRGARPWLILSSSRYPHQGQDYIACSLKTNLRRMHHVIHLEPRDWVRGRPPRPSRIDSQTLFTLKHAWIQGQVGTVSETKLLQAQSMVRSYLGA
jgi:mRNA-degrading endonuclease toxin of MazEF toxin-antitoxin module